MTSCKEDVCRDVSRCVCTSVLPVIHTTHGELEFTKDDRAHQKPNIDSDDSVRFEKCDTSKTDKQQQVLIRIDIRETHVGSVRPKNASVKHELPAHLRHKIEDAISDIDHSLTHCKDNRSDFTNSISVNSGEFRTREPSDLTTYTKTNESKQFIFKDRDAYNYTRTSQLDQLHTDIKNNNILLPSPRALLFIQNLRARKSIKRMDLTETCIGQLAHQDRNVKSQLSGYTFYSAARSAFLYQNDPPHFYHIPHTDSALPKCNSRFTPNCYETPSSVIAPTGLATPSMLSTPTSLATPEKSPRTYICIHTPVRETDLDVRLDNDASYIGD